MEYDYLLFESASTLEPYTNRHPLFWQAVFLDTNMHWTLPTYREYGDLEKADTIVLKESDYIKYEQEHPLICTFIKSLLVNHTFVFLGYSLNDNNLNLIIGWINYFRELHGIEARPANFWIDSKPSTPFEQARLENRNTYFDHSHIGIWELKAFAYDYYFFFKENGIPLDYFSEPKEYLSYYLKALLCSYSPESRDSDILGIGAHKDERYYPIGEVDLDMLVKFTSPKTLKSWLEKYSVQKLKIEDGLDITQKFVNLCTSLAHFRIRYWPEQVHCFAIILCLVDLGENSKCTIFKALAEVVAEAAKSAPVMAEEIFEAIDLAINHILVKGNCVERALLLDALLADEIYPVLIERKNSSFGRILRKFSNEISEEVKSRIRQHIDAIEDVAQKVKRLYFFRCFYTREFCRSFFQEHFDYLSSEQCYSLLTGQFIPFEKKCWAKFISTLEKQDAARKAQPGMRTFPDWLMVTIEECMILKLLGFDIDLTSLEPYVHYSEHLSFMVNPDAFAYSQVKTENYMWQNLIYSKEYQPYFVKHKSEVLSDDLRKSFDLGIATEEQQKIVYGILLDQDELQRF